MAVASSSSSSVPRWKYDVFINFRGEDTRRGFVSHLYKALNQKAINTFIDAEELRKGNDLSQLLTAIRDSSVSIVVFSQNYASSTWCLKELVQILECMDVKNQMVVPVFYQVDPSHVRKMKRRFAEAFAEHESNPNAATREVRSWRYALKRATNLSGWDSRKYEDDAKLIDEIVEDIFSKLIQISSSEADDGLVGRDSHIQEMDIRLSPRVKDDVRVVGIWGMGGLGKTTIARAVYDKIACQFEADCVLENVKEGFSKDGAVHMQEVLLSRILKEKVQRLGTLDRGSNMIMERLGKKKVLLVLDDVDNLAQIETLLGRNFFLPRKKHSFGGGSRIIITTRDKRLLSKVDETYEPRFLGDDEALELFGQFAFRTLQPTGDYTRLSRHAIEYARGLPLALKVLGAFLDNKSVDEWEDVLEKIKEAPHIGIQDVLRTSFDGLDDKEKDIFLDIVCFFKGMKKDYATKVLASSGFFPHSGLRVLVDKALVTLSHHGTLEMHDLLVDTGREIIRQESIKEPGKRSRLWNYEDVVRVLTQNTATEAVESIILDLSNSSKEVCLKTEAFERMTRLRLLKIHYNHSLHSDAEDLSYKDAFHPSDYCKQHLSGDLSKFFSNELRCLLWHGFPQKSLPSSFQPKNLIDLNMRYSHMEKLWDGTNHLFWFLLNDYVLECLTITYCMFSWFSCQSLKKLNFIDLSHSQYLTKTPNFTEATNIEKLILEGCTRLLEVHPSILTLKNLVFLNLKGCKELKSFPSIVPMKSLGTLNLSGCSSFDKFPEISEIMESLSVLHLAETAIKELPSSIKNLTGLAYMNLKGCGELESLPSSICQLKSLSYVALSDCSKLKVFPDLEENMEGMRELHLDGTSIEELSPSINRFMRLAILNLRNCKSLFCLPENICKLACLTGLSLSGCSKLSNLPDNLGNLESLWDLQMEGSGIKQFPFSILRLNKLLSLSCDGCKELRAPFSSWPSIRVHRTSALRYHGYSTLESLDLSDCNLLEISDCIAYLTSVKRLNLCRNDIETLPGTMVDLGGLMSLELDSCKRLKSIPMLSSSISYIDAHDCTALEYVSSPMPNWGNLYYFIFSNCSHLEQNPLMHIMQCHLSLGILPHSFYTCLPGSEVPDWFSYRCRGSSVNVQLSLNLYDDKFSGFAICAVCNLQGAHSVSDLSALCFCNFKGNHGQHSFSFYLFKAGLRADRFSYRKKGTDRFLDSDHMFLGYVPWSDYRLIEGERARERFYTEATFTIILEDGIYTGDFGTELRRRAISSCGVRFFDAN